ncbi:hypothetical protein [Polyangium aurulentum]|uniref:hypothetical protein n=1 Tax=Polyangium aurulentum TaxID=2567896 RepID=UPI0010AECF67|nr:hypothetical protein [Polyangium aurulentum]UQA58245.1 hypothetical protein E8A73_044520 [Polyangium aurulentum]
MTTAETAPTHAPNPPQPEPAPAERAHAPSILQFVRPIAAFAVVAMVLGRAVGPSIRGVAVGMGRVSEVFERIGAAVSQMFLIAATVFAMALGLTALRTRLPAHVRYGGLVAGGAVILVTMSAAASPVPGPSSVLIGAAASVLALVAAVDAMRAPFARSAAIALGFVGLEGLFRIAAVLLAMRDTGAAPTKATSLAGGFATFGLVLGCGAMVMAVGYIASRTKKLTSPATFAAMALALIATRQAIAGAHDDAGALSVLLGRATRALMLRPEPLGPATLITFLVLLAPALAVAALATRALVPALAGALALALLAHGAPDVPLCALALVIASLATALAARDQRGFWASLTRTSAAPATAEPARPSEPEPAPPSTDAPEAQSVDAQDRVR